MSIKNIKIALDKARENLDNMHWVDEEFTDLLFLIAERMIDQDGGQETGIPPGYMTLREFESKYKFISRETLNDYCRSQSSEVRQWCYVIGHKWYIHEEKTLEFLKKKPIFKKRMERLGQSW